MPISWMTVLQGVPWGEVIANAPKVADAARKLWNRSAGRSGTETTAPGDAPVDATAALESRVAALEAKVADLHARMLDSSELIKALAEQNTQLIARVELSRRLAWAVGIVAVVGLIGLAVLWVRLGG